MGVCECVDICASVFRCACVYGSVQLTKCVSWNIQGGGGGELYSVPLWRIIFICKFCDV